MAKANHHDAILESALAAFHRKGYHATSVQDIVALADVPKGSFYNHFESKETLGKAVIDLYWSKAGPVRDILKERAPVPLRIDRHFKALGCPMEGCLLGNLSAELASEDPFRGCLSGYWSLWLKSLTACMSEGQQDGTVRKDISAGDLARFALMQWEGSLLTYRIERDPALLAKARRFIQEFITK